MGLRPMLIWNAPMAFHSLNAGCWYGNGGGEVFAAFLNDRTFPQRHDASALSVRYALAVFPERRSLSSVTLAQPASTLSRCRPEPVICLIFAFTFRM